VFSSKKGIEAGVLVYLIAGLAVFAATAHLVVKLGTNAENVGRDEACRKSIQFASISKKLPSADGPIGTGRSYVPLQCDREDIILKHKDIVEDGKINQNKAHKIIADEMYRCWRKTGEGKIDPFSNWDLDGESLCMMCGVIRFDDKLKDFIRKKSEQSTKVNDYMVEGFLPYLMKTQVPYQKVSYYEALYGKKPTVEDLKKAEEDAEKVNEVISPGSVILVQMYKLESKSTFGTYTRYIIAGVGITAAAITLLFPPTWPAWGSVLATLAPVLIAKATLIVSAYSLFATTADSFKDCPDCNGIGGIHFVPALMAFDEEIELKYTDKEDNQKTAKTKLCTILVN